MLAPARLLLLSALAACGAPVAPRAPDAPIARAEVMPDGYVALGTTRVGCGGMPAWGRLGHEPLTRFECSFETLSQALAEQGRARGATLVAGRRCQGKPGGALSCTATFGRAADERAAEPAGPLLSTPPEGSLRFETAASIRVDLEPTVATFSRRARLPDEVGEHRDLPVSHVALGSIKARCAFDACRSRDLRTSLRVAAGAFGVSDLAGVSCRETSHGSSCVATLAAPERDPERDALAR